MTILTNTNSLKSSTLRLVLGVSKSDKKHDLILEHPYARR